ncbi:MAG: phosphoglycerate kinase [Candidatus Paceibacterota bacterium]
MMKTIDRLGKKDLDGKKVLLRVDFNVPVEGGKLISNDLRIRSHKETVDYLVRNGARVLLVSHINDLDGFGSIVEQIGVSLNQTLTLLPMSGWKSMDILFRECCVMLLDNVRQDQREVENDDGFAKELADGFDLYVNDAFAVSHREHASVSAIVNHLPAYAGFLVKKEVEGLSLAMDTPMDGKILVMGGAKISTKLPVIKNFINKAEKILVGGALSNDLFQARGINVGSSLVSGEVSPDVQSDKIILPEDVVVTEDKSGKTKSKASPVEDISEGSYMVDIGPETAKKFAEIISKAKIVIWNGPMGLFEVEEFSAGTNVVAKAVASAKHSIVGGGETVEALEKLGLLDKISFTSTGGGAMLDFLAGMELPGLKALGYYE